MILVSVQNPGDVQLTRALLQSLGERFEWFLLFSNGELRQRMGDIPCRHGFDVAFCLLNAANFQAVVSFAGLLHPGMTRNILLLSFFNEIGVPTFEIQHGLFQYGINLVDAGFQVGAHTGRGDQLGLPIGYAARNVVPWAGPEGIGYPKSVLKPRPSSRRAGYVLITSNNHWHVYEARHRREFGLAVSELAKSRSDLEFVWKPHFAEDLMPESKQVLDTIGEMKLPNLHIERAGDAEDLIPGCVFGVSTVSTVLLDFEIRGKPALVYDAEPVRPLIERMRVASFRDAQDLPAKAARLLAEPERHLTHTGVEPFAPERLATRLEQAIRPPSAARDPLPVALKYLDHFRAQTAAAQPGDIDRAVAQIAQDLARVAGAISREVGEAKGTLSDALQGAAGAIKEQTQRVGEDLSNALRATAGDVRQETAQGTADLSRALQDAAASVRQEMALGATRLSRELANVTSGVEHASRKLSDFQRSTLAYKLKKVFKGSARS